MDCREWRARRSVGVDGIVITVFMLIAGHVLCNSSPPPGTYSYV
jgi:hypothetical protein